MTTGAIDNDLYDREPESWWSENGFLNLLQSATNPWRLPYFKRVLSELNLDPGRKRALEVGCGGGLLSEEIARMGYRVIGVDPSEKSLAVARRHAQENHLEIDYQHGIGEHLPFDPHSFDIALCCDVLEHVKNWEAVISEVSRVLAPGGVFFYNTVNRTATSYKNAIRMMQEMWLTRFAPPRMHVWEMFITPDELMGALEKYGLDHKEIVGARSEGSAFQVVSAILLHRVGIINSAEFGKRIRETESPDTSVNYMGYAIKR